MKTLLFFGLLIIVVFGGSVKLFSRFKTKSSLQYIFFSGTIFLLFGLLIGENGLKLVSSDILSHLSPILHFSLGWVGFIFGFQFEWRYLKRIQIYKYLAFLLSYMILFLMIFLFTFLTLKLFFPAFISSSRILFGTAILLAFLFSESSFSFVTWGARFFKEEVTGLKLCSFISTMNNLIPIFLTGIIFSVYRFNHDSRAIELNELSYIVKHFLFQFGAAIFFGFLIYLLQKKVEDKYDLSVILFGSIFLISGLSFIYDLSPLFIAMFAGAIFANLTKKHHFILKIINPTERPIYLFFLLILSFKMAYFNLLMVVFVVLLLFIKYYSNLLAFKAVNRIKPVFFSMPPHLSVLLIPISSIGPAILLDLSITYPIANTSMLSGIFILGMLIAEVLSPIGVSILMKTKHD